MNADGSSPVQITTAQATTSDRRGHPTDTDSVRRTLAGGAHALARRDADGTDDQALLSDGGDGRYFVPDWG